MNRYSINGFKLGPSILFSIIIIIDFVKHLFLVSPEWNKDSHHSLRKKNIIELWFLFSLLKKLLSIIWLFAHRSRWDEERNKWWLPLSFPPLLFCSLTFSRYFFFFDFSYLENFVFLCCLKFKHLWCSLVFFQKSNASNLFQFFVCFPYTILWVHNLVKQVDHCCSSRTKLIFLNKISFEAIWNN